MEEIKIALNKLKVEFKDCFDVSEISSMKIGKKTPLVVFPKNISEFVKVLKLFYKRKVYFRVLGNLSNVLVVEDLNYPLIITSKMKDEYTVCGREVTFSAGMQLSRVLEILKRKGLGGFEALAGIPATIGGLVMNNAGAFGVNASDNLISVQVFSKGQVFSIPAKNIKFGYHYSNLYGFVLLSASFWFENKNEYDIINLCNKYLYLRSISQPNGLSLGSVYGRICGKSAGFFIERAGLKEMRVGGVFVSKKHANFFLNNKTGSVEDFLKLQEIVEETVEKQFGVKLIPEIEKIGGVYEVTGRSAHTFK